MRDRSFGPTVLIGLAGGTLAAVASGRDWATSTSDAAGVAVTAAARGSDAAPLALALSLVALAAWGAVLVLRGRVRNVVAAIGLLASVGVLLSVLDAWDGAQDAAVEAVRAGGATSDMVSTTLTGWYWTSAVGAVLSLLAFAVASRRARAWPAMGTRYDAPSGRPAPAATVDDDRELWRSIDQGHDPTA